MANSLKKFATWNDKNQFEIDGRIIIPYFDGVSCWERCHPTFISKKRKVILTAPRKVGHSSIRFYFNLYLVSVSVLTSVCICLKGP